MVYLPGCESNTHHFGQTGHRAIDHPGGCNTHDGPGNGASSCDSLPGFTPPTDGHLRVIESEEAGAGVEEIAVLAARIRSHPCGPSARETSVPLDWTLPAGGARRTLRSSRWAGFCCRLADSLAASFSAPVAPGLEIAAHAAPRASRRRVRRYGGSPPLRARRRPARSHRSD
jgi:hypothetical protein